MTSNIEKYKEDLDRLIKLGEDMTTNITNDLIMELDLSWEEKNKLYEEAKKDPGKNFMHNYQIWYSESYEVIRNLLPNRLGEFEILYKGEKRSIINYNTYTIKDLMLGIRASSDFPTGKKSFNDLAAAGMRFGNQLMILKSAQKRFESTLFDVKQLIQADLFDSELDIAKELNDKGYSRAAGAVSGVVLEKHLGQVCQNHNIPILKKDPSINDFNTVLKDNKIIEIPIWRFIQHLRDLRNLCDHNKEKEPKSEEIEDLINGVKKIMKTVF